MNSMSDLFHERITTDFIARVFEVIAACPQHVFQILTKRPQRMLQLIRHDLNYEGPEWPLKNVWLGVSVEDQATADERIPLLLQTPAIVRWISAEPLLGKIDLLPFFRDFERPAGYHVLDWVVVGGESGKDRRQMVLEDARSIIEQCVSCLVPVFVKQDNGPQPGMQGRFTAEEWALKEYPE